MKQVLIALDQLANTLVWAAEEGFGMADETISARCWRLRHRRATWGAARAVVDTLFFLETEHCFDAFRKEQARRHLPPAYRTKNAD